MHRYGDFAHKTISDYNMYGLLDGSYSVTERFINYTLSDWKTHSGKDQNSFVGVAQYVGTDMTKIASYALAAGSPGKGAASNGKDLGADVSMVGPDASMVVGEAPAPIVPPVPPMNLRIVVSGG